MSWPVSLSPEIGSQFTEHRQGSILWNVVVCLQLWLRMYLPRHASSDDKVVHVYINLSSYHTIHFEKQPKAVHTLAIAEH